MCNYLMKKLTYGGCQSYWSKVGSGLKLVGSSAFPPFPISMILAVHQHLGAVKVVDRILENRVARKWWTEGKCHKWWYIIPSVPGAEFFLQFFSIFLITLGVIGDISNSSRT